MKHLQLTVTEDELGILETAIGLWETQPTSDGVMASMFQAAMSGQPKEEKFSEIHERMAAAHKDSQSRKLTAARLRVKFLEVHERPSEFEVEKHENG